MQNLQNLKLNIAAANDLVSELKQFRESKDYIYWKSAEDKAVLIGVEYTGIRAQNVRRLR